MYSIMRLAKYGRSAVYGVCQERERDKERNADREYGRSDIDETQTARNIVMTYPDTAPSELRDKKIQSDNWNKEITNQIKGHGCKERKDSVVMVGAVFTASKDFFTENPDYVRITDKDLRKKIAKGEIEDPREPHQRARWVADQKLIDYFNDCLQVYVDTVCGGDWSKLVSAKIDLDETTPHMQAYSVPIIGDGSREHPYKLSAKELFGGRGEMRARQDYFHEQVGKKHGLARGEKVYIPEIDGKGDAPEQQKEKMAKNRSHTDTMEWRREQQRQLEQSVQSLTTDKQGLEASIGDLETVHTQAVEITTQAVEGAQRATEALTRAESELGDINTQLNDKKAELADTEAVIADNREAINKAKDHVALLKKTDGVVAKMINEMTDGRSKSQDEGVLERYPEQTKTKGFGKNKQTVVVRPACVLVEESVWNERSQSGYNKTGAWDMQHAVDVINKQVSDAALEADPQNAQAIIQQLQQQLARERAQHRIEMRRMLYERDAYKSTLESLHEEKPEFQKLVSLEARYNALVYAIENEPGFTMENAVQMAKGSEDLLLKLEAYQREQLRAAANDKMNSIKVSDHVAGARAMKEVDNVVRPGKVAALSAALEKAKKQEHNHKRGGEEI